MMYKSQELLIQIFITFYKIQKWKVRISKIYILLSTYALSAVPPTTFPSLPGQGLPFFSKKRKQKNRRLKPLQGRLVQRQIPAYCKAFEATPSVNRRVVAISRGLACSYVNTQYAHLTTGSLSHNLSQDRAFLFFSKKRKQKNRRLKPLQGRLVQRQTGHIAKLSRRHIPLIKGGSNK